MEDLLRKLYSIPNFSKYLMIAIAVLCFLFILVLFLGKKDKKKREIEETKKLQVLNNENAFKEEENIEKVEVQEENVLSDTIAVPTINDLIKEEIPNEEVVLEENIEEKNNMPFINEDKIVENEAVTEDHLENDTIVISPIDNLEDEKDVVEDSPVLEKIEEQPLVLNEYEEDELVEVPDFNYDKIVNDVEDIKSTEPEKRQEIFSSVYAPSFEEKYEEPKEEKLEFELPSLKKEEPTTMKEEVQPVSEESELPELKDYDLDSLSGETYTINKN